MDDPNFWLQAASSFILILVAVAFGFLQQEGLDKPEKAIAASIPILGMLLIGYICAYLGVFPNDHDYDKLKVIYPARTILCIISFYMARRYVGQKRLFIKELGVAGLLIVVLLTPGYLSFYIAVLPHLPF